jgi:hypothetical protein
MPDGIDPTMPDVVSRVVDLEKQALEIRAELAALASSLTAAATDLGVADKVAKIESWIAKSAGTVL